MTNSDEPGSCLQYCPGRILCLRREPYKQTSLRPSRNTGVSLLQAEAFPDLGVTLQLFSAMPGTELGALDEVRSRDGVVATSLDYFGRSAGLFTRRAKVTSNEWYLTSDEVEARTTRSTRDAELPRVLVVDVDPAHCRDVVNAVGYGARSILGGGGIAVVGICSADATATIVTLWEYVTLLLRGASIPGRTLAVNMSVDWGVVCGIGAENVNVPEGALSTTSVAFPFFEKTLAVLQQRLSSDGSNGRSSTIPAFFAAAGNRRYHDRLRWRMAYPAICSGVIAATFVDSAESPTGVVDLSADVDCPSVFDVKPCFGVDVATHTVGPRTDGSSFACAWLAGSYAAHAADGGRLAAAPAMAKTALLHSGASLLRLRTTPEYWAQPAVSVMHRLPAAVERSSFEVVLGELNGLEHSVEFVATGSLAMLHAMLVSRGREWRDLRGCVTTLADLDLIHSREPSLSSLHRSQEIVREWAQQALSTEALPVDHGSLASRVGFPSLAQCVIPAAQLLATQDGIVDSGGGVADVQNASLRILLPPDDAWYSNPQFLAESAGVAVGVLVWLGAALLLQIARAELGLADRVPLDEASVSLVRKLLRTKRDAESECIFGPDPHGAGAQRFNRRLNRARNLLLWARSRTLNIEVQKELLEELERAYPRRLS